MWLIERGMSSHLPRTPLLLLIRYPHLPITPGPPPHHSPPSPILLSQWYPFVRPLPMDMKCSAGRFWPRVTAWWWRSATTSPRAHRERVSSRERTLWPCGIWTAPTPATCTSCMAGCWCGLVRQVQRVELGVG